jgi:drug/metabolite transporter (DMT)-like permease
MPAQMGLDISASSLFAGFLYGVIGIFIFRKGKKEAEFDMIFIGIALMVYPYFTHGPLADWGIGAALCAIAYYKPHKNF